MADKSKADLSRMPKLWRIFRLIDWLRVLPESLKPAFRRELIQYE